MQGACQSWRPRCGSACLFLHCRFAPPPSGLQVAIKQTKGRQGEEAPRHTQGLQPPVSLNRFTVGNVESCDWQAVLMKRELRLDRHGHDAVAMNSTA